MASNKLTDKSLRGLKPTSKEQTVGDGGGLWVRVLPVSNGGAINFYYRFELDGKERRFNCGSYPATTLAEARKNRSGARSSVAKGIDPVLQQGNDRLHARAAQALQSMEKTVSELLDDWERVYLTAHRKDKGKAAVEAVKFDVLPVIGQMKAKEVRLPHISSVLDRILARGTRRKANMALSLMRQMFRHGLGRGIVETDPTLAISRRQAGGKETPSDRNLSLPEISELGSKLLTAGLHERTQAAVLFLLATGARVGELIKARWVEIDETAKTWIIPSVNSKNGRAHLIHLSDFAMSELTRMKKYKSGDFLLSGRKKGEPISQKTISKTIRDRIRSEPLKNRTAKTKTLLLADGEWSPHDLRRTMASRMGDIGIAPHVIERCLNHIQQGIVGVYQRQEYLKERKDAFDTWGNQLDQALNQSKPPTSPERKKHGRKTDKI